MLQHQALEGECNRLANQVAEAEGLRQEYDLLTQNYEDTQGCLAEVVRIFRIMATKAEVLFEEARGLK